MSEMNDTTVQVDAIVFPTAEPDEARANIRINGATFSFPITATKGLQIRTSGEAKLRIGASPMKNPNEIVAKIENISFGMGGAKPRVTLLLAPGLRQNFTVTESMAMTLRKKTNASIKLV